MATAETRQAAVLGIDPEAIEAALAKDMTFPARWYSDPAIYDFELERIFTRAWQLVGSLDRVSRPGDCMVGNIGHVPVIVTRGLDGDLRGFVNVCRHRAYPVATADGNRKTLQCFYHGWTYKLDGSLHNAPRAGREACFDKSEFGLVPISVDTWDEFVFGNPDPDARSLRDTHPEFEPMLAERGLSFAGYEHHSSYSYEIAANWKVMVENGTECYHCPTVHKSSFSDAFEVDADVYEYVNRGQMLGQFTQYNPKPKRHPSDARASEKAFRFTYVWPSTFLAQDDYTAFTGVLTPTGPETCLFSGDFFAHPEADPKVIEDWIEMWNETFAEDVVAVAIQQPGLRSRMVPHGRLMPASESAISRFHRMVWEAMVEALDG
ncbi:MAG TPA: aromatic ring-hydroxylating dioxygenase subunit alpha [Gaiellales bacterium]|jgi:phenylpropionate dioxygenase-like ring-hydroxylating dioxygenase large terminal subunit|nr:aromatic ring-hydroxylating dioxygenase subunit alpha [Gaiellales bacterium]